MISECLVSRVLISFLPATISLAVDVEKEDEGGKEGRIDPVTVTVSYCLSIIEFSHTCTHTQSVGIQKK